MLPDAASLEPWSAKLVSAVVRRTVESPYARRDACSALIELQQLNLAGMDTAVVAAYPTFKNICTRCDAGPDPVEAFLGTYGPVLPERDADSIRSELKTWREAEPVADRARKAVEEARSKADETRSGLEDILADIREAHESATTYQLTGWIVAELDDQTYEVQPLGARYYPLGHYPTSSHIILLTNNSSFTSTGRFTMWVEERGTRPFTTLSGFVESVLVVEEDASIDVLEAELPGFRNDLRDAERALSQVQRDLSAAQRSSERARDRLERALKKLPPSIVPPTSEPPTPTSSREEVETPSSPPQAEPSSQPPVEPSSPPPAEPSSSRRRHRTKRPAPSETADPSYGRRL
jgi:hypothetical protein